MSDFKNDDLASGSAETSTNLESVRQPNAGYDQNGWMNRHTPAPWQLDQREEDSIELFLSEEAATQSRYRAIHRIELYDGIYPEDADYGEAFANCRLIAAAPSLLEAVRSARDYIATDLDIKEQSYLPEPNEDEAEDLAETRALLEMLDAEIFHATGQVPEPQTVNVARSEPVQAEGCGKAKTKEGDK